MFFPSFLSAGSRLRGRITPAEIARKWSAADGELNFRRIYQRLDENFRRNNGAIFAVRTKVVCELRTFCCSDYAARVVCRL